MPGSLLRVATTIVVGLLVVGCASAPSPEPVATQLLSVAPTASSTSANASPVLTAAPIATRESPATASGWPYTTGSRRVVEPVFVPDGSVYLLAGARDAVDGSQQSLVALDAAGQVKPGWPVEEPPGSDFGSPAVGPDGSIYFEECGGPEVGCVLHRLDATGRELPGWPFEEPPTFACAAGARRQC